ncbi:hypothetical protein B9Z55_020901 [Caenorhabditis nigoni]|nr:hypothetical protein B9Z55_020901 [Caenorhabditis nigoni]
MQCRKYAAIKSNDVEMPKIQGEDNPSEEISTKVADNKISYEQYRERFEIDRERLKIVPIPMNKLGEGYFGITYRAELTRNNPDVKLLVATKRAHEKKYKQEILMKEILVMCVMADRKHPNLLAIVGAITSNPMETWIVTELAATDLKNYIGKNRTNFDDMLSGNHKTDEITINDEYNTLSSLDLILFAYQISKGMEHLTNIPCVHRDLALRNVLITERKIIRIGDFGLAMKYEDKDYLSKSPIPKNRIPSHSAPEIINEGKYTEKSDIWSFGLCLFQLFTLSTDTDLYSKEDVEEFMKNNNPLKCRSEIFEFLEMCWYDKPRHRPNFKTCVYTFKCELNRFSNQIHKNIEAKLDLEAKQQLELEKWTNSGGSHEETE